jgi:hypothetical protein
VPYEKGFSFLCYLQSLVGIEKFEQWLRAYVTKVLVEEREREREGEGEGKERYILFALFLPGRIRRNCEKLVFRGYPVIFFFYANYFFAFC